MEKVMSVRLKNAKHVSVLPTFFGFCVCFLYLFIFFISFLQEHQTEEKREHMCLKIDRHMKFRTFYDCIIVVFSPFSKNRSIYTLRGYLLQNLFNHRAHQHTHTHIFGWKYRSSCRKKLFAFHFIYSFASFGVCIFVLSIWLNSHSHVWWKRTHQMCGG